MFLKNVVVELRQVWEDGFSTAGTLERLRRKHVMDCGLVAAVRGGAVGAVLAADGTAPPQLLNEMGPEAAAANANM
jgi:hypothetical protein